MRAFTLWCITWIFVTNAIARSPTADQSPQFVGNLSISPVVGAKGRIWALNNDFGFFDGASLWLAKKDDRTDGASIPSVFWVLIGHPFNTNYIEAAVVHDHFCQKGKQTRTWQDTHRMFYSALVATNRLDYITAKAMFYAVYLFGPRWDLIPEKPCAQGRECVSIPIVENFQPKWGSDEEVQQQYEYIFNELKHGDMSLEDLEERASSIRNRLKAKKVEVFEADIGQVDVKDRR